MNGLAGRTRRAGFTLIELVIVTALVAVFSVMIFPPLMGALTNANQQATMTHMDRAADAALNNITSALREAIIPVTTLDTLQERYRKADFWPTNKTPLTTEFREGAGEFANNDENDSERPVFATLDFYRVLNSVQGFYATRADNGEDYTINDNQISHGHAWRAVLESGADFIPFTVPVDYRGPGTPDGDNDHLDANYIVELGVKLPNGEPVAAAEYLFYKPGSWGSTYNVLGDNPLHPSLQLLKPSDFDFTVTGAVGSLSVTDSGYARRAAAALALPAGVYMHGFAILRFVADSDSLSGGAPLLLYGENLARTRAEAYGGDPIPYVSGHLEITYIVDNKVYHSRPLTPMNTVLLHADRTRADWQPLFKLVRTTSTLKDDDVDKHIGHTIEVNLLLYDYNAQVGQRTTFKAKSAMTNLVRTFKTKVQLRNMARR